jgi:hypothetical protein
MATINGNIDLTPAPERVALPQNYITDFNFLNQYLPDTYEKEFERYGNRSVSGFLRMVGAELPSASDKIIWAEQGRLHMKYDVCASAGGDTDPTATITITHAQDDPVGLKAGMTILVDDNAAASGNSNKAIITSVTYNATTTTSTIAVAYYEAGGQAGTMASCTIFVYGSEFKKGSQGMEESVEPVDNIFSNSPIIIKEKYTASGSDMSQIGWVEVTTENGATGYMWYLKAEHETRLRFDDYLETAMVEAVPAEAASGAIAVTGRYGDKGMEGIFYQVDANGNTADGALTALTDIDSIVEVLDQQGAIEENVLFVNRTQSFAIDDMLAAQNSYGAGGTSYGLFDNDEQMALNLGFSGFRRGYDFYKSDWKYLNDATMRGGLTNDIINGLLVPAGSTNVYDQILGKNAKRPFLHVRYRASEAENRRYKTWVTGSAGGARTSDLDAMEVHFLSERAVCVMGANNFFLLKG